MRRGSASRECDGRAVGEVTGNCAFSGLFFDFSSHPWTHDPSALILPQRNASRSSTNELMGAIAVYPVLVGQQRAR